MSDEMKLRQLGQCPRCGAHPSYLMYEVAAGETGCYFVRCTHCNRIGDSGVGFEGARRGWLAGITVGAIPEALPLEVVRPLPPTDHGVRFDILHEAAGAVKNRAGSYGSPADNFQRIAERWTMNLRHAGKLKDGEEISASDVGMLLMDFKLARLSPDHNYRDGYVDIAGYAACTGEVVS